MRIAERVTGKKLLALDYPPQHVSPRYGYGRPPHAGLLELLRAGEEAYRRNLGIIMSYEAQLAAIALEDPASGSPPWISNWLLGLDVASLYGLVRARQPANYVEVGSGTSTVWVRRALADQGTSARITSIDPAPRSEIEQICDRSVREPLETVDLTLFDDLGEGDVVFMDGSHRVFTNSDATVFFLDVLPRLPAGVLVGVHDILLPDDYLPMWSDWYWSEQYLMATYLLGGAAGIHLELACNYVSGHSSLRHVLDPLWAAPGLEEVDRRGFAFWFTTYGTRPTQTATAPTPARS